MITDLSASNGMGQGQGHRARVMEHNVYTHVLTRLRGNGPQVETASPDGMHNKYSRVTSHTMKSITQ